MGTTHPIYFHNFSSHLYEPTHITPIINDVCVRPTSKLYFKAVILFNLKICIKVIQLCIRFLNLTTPPQTYVISLFLLPSNLFLCDVNSTASFSHRWIFSLYFGIHAILSYFFLWHVHLLIPSSLSFLHTHTNLQNLHAVFLPIKIWSKNANAHVSVLVFDNDTSHKKLIQLA